jgi:hypothetical protein
LQDTANGNESTDDQNDAVMLLGQLEQFSYERSSPVACSSSASALVMSLPRGAR